MQALCEYRVINMHFLVKFENTALAWEPHCLVNQNETTFVHDFLPKRYR